MRILVAHRQGLFRCGLKSLLEARGYGVVAEASRGGEAVELARRFRPDLVLMGVALQPREELEATSRLIRELPGTKVILLADSAAADLDAAAGTGAHGFVSSSLPAAEFLDLVEAVRQGTARAIAPRGNSPNHRAGVLPKPGGDTEALTDRERELLQLLVRGVTSNRELAGRLEVSENTVRFHMRNVFAKLRLGDRTQAVAFALRNGLLD